MKDRYIFAYVILKSTLKIENQVKISVFNSSFCCTSRTRVNSVLQVLIYKLKACGNPVLDKSIGSVFQTVFANFVALSHFGYCNISDF